MLSVFPNNCNFCKETWNHCVFNIFQFVAHPNCQQLLATLWYEGCPGFRRRNIVCKLLITVTIGLMFPLLSITYLIAPKSSFGKLIRKPFIKFICHSSSYITFLGKPLDILNVKIRAFCKTCDTENLYE